MFNIHVGNWMTSIAWNDSFTSFYIYPSLCCRYTGSKTLHFFSHHGTIGATALHRGIVPHDAEIQEELRTAPQARDVHPADVIEMSPGLMVPQTTSKLLKFHHSKSSILRCFFLECLLLPNVIKGNCSLDMIFAHFLHVCWRPAIQQAKNLEKKLFGPVWQFCSKSKVCLSAFIAVCV